MEVCQHMETNNTEMNTLLHLIICFPPFGNCSFGLLPCRIPPSGIPPSGMIPVICDRSQKCSFSCIPKELFSLVLIQNVTENLTSFRNMVFTGRGHLDYDVRL